MDVHGFVAKKGFPAESTKESAQVIFDRSALILRSSVVLCLHLRIWNLQGIRSYRHQLQYLQALYDQYFCWVSIFMLRILRLLSYAAVIIAIWIASLQLDLSRNVHFSLLAVSASFSPNASSIPMQMTLDRVQLLKTTEFLIKGWKGHWINHKAHGKFSATPPLSSRGPSRAFKQQVDASYQPMYDADSVLMACRLPL